MRFADYPEFDGVGLAGLVATKAISPAELVEATIERIEAHNDVLNAVVYKAYDESRHAASGALPDGPFRGVPFLMKDIGRPVAGWPSSWGSRFAETPPATDDCVIVRRYREAGLVLLGATNTPEFGIPGVTHSARLGPCRTPWNVDHISGGSSGGAAAAVASGIVPMAHAMDGGGSIRIPAACCGLVGLKTTRNRNPVDPGARMQMRDHIVDHIVCRTVRDSAAMLDATSAPQPASPYATPPRSRPFLDEVGRSPGQLKVAWSGETPFGTPFDPEVATALEKTADLLGALSHEVPAEGLGIDYGELYRAYRDVAAVCFAGEMLDVIERVGREPGEGEIEPLASRLYARGKALSGLQAADAFQRSRILSWQVLERFQTIDVYLTPTLGTLPPRVEDFDPLDPDLSTFDERSRETFCFTIPFNMTGQPSISLPLWQSESGLPIGMMFTARFGDEATLFRLAAQFETELPWRGRRPPVWG